VKTTRTRNLLAAAFACALGATTAHAQPADSSYKFERGYPVAGTAERVHDASDMRRAIEAYKFVYPTVAPKPCTRNFRPGGSSSMRTR
jgi:hypothetical protein